MNDMQFNLTNGTVCNTSLRFLQNKVSASPYFQEQYQRIFRLLANGEHVDRQGYKLLMELLQDFRFINQQSMHDLTDEDKKNLAKDF